MLKDVFKLATCAISFLRLRQNYIDIQKCNFLLINIVRGLFISKSLYKHDNTAGGEKSNSSYNRSRHNTREPNILE